MYKLHKDIKGGNMKKSFQFFLVIVSIMGFMLLGHCKKNAYQYIEFEQHVLNALGTITNEHIESGTLESYWAYWDTVCKQGEKRACAILLGKISLVASNLDTLVTQYQELAEKYSKPCLQDEMSNKEACEIMAIASSMIYFHIKYHHIKNKTRLEELNAIYLTDISQATLYNQKSCEQGNEGSCLQLLALVIFGGEDTQDTDVLTLKEKILRLTQPKLTINDKPNPIVLLKLHRLYFLLGAYNENQGKQTEAKKNREQALQYAKQVCDVGITFMCMVKNLES